MGSLANRYNADRMVLSVAGNVDAERVREIAREILPAETQPEFL